VTHRHACNSADHEHRVAAPHDHSHSHSHDHAHGHVHAPTSFGRAFAIAIALNGLIVAAEAICGVAGGSVALLADAGHNLSDLLGLSAAFAAHVLGRRAPSARFTYGFGASSILAALFNSVLLLVVTGALGLEAIQRLFHPEPVAATVVMAVAGAAILVNGLSAWLLAAGDGNDLNVRAAAAHLASDAGVAAGVVVAAGLIKLTGWQWVDPALSLAINAAIIWGTWRLLREAVALSLAGVPQTVSSSEVRGTLAALPGVAALHDLHIWPMSTSEIALTVHLVMPEGHPGDAFLLEVSHTLAERYRINHATLQVETQLDGMCRLMPDAVV
jgi:cobalt-zinc-cadmium efflux system protein